MPRPPGSASTGSAAASSAKRFCLLALDFESTGCSVDKDRIIDMALVDLSSGRDWRTAVNPNLHSLNRKITQLTGISWGDTREGGVPGTPEALRALIAFVMATCASLTAPALSAAAVDDTSNSTPVSAVVDERLVVPVLLVHNGACFDIPLLRNECQRHGVALPLGWCFLDTYKLVQAHKLKDKYDKGQLANYKLGTLKAFFQVADQGAAHTALADARVLAHVYPHLQEACGQPELAALIAEGHAAGRLESCRCQVEDREQRLNMVLHRWLPAGEPIRHIDAACWHDLIESNAISARRTPTRGGPPGSSSGGNGDVPDYWNLGWAARLGAPLLLLLREVHIDRLVCPKTAYQAGSSAGGPWRPSWDVLLSSKTCAVEQLGAALDAFVRRTAAADVGSGAQPRLHSCMKQHKGRPMLCVALETYVVPAGPSRWALELRTGVHDLPTGQALTPMFPPIVSAATSSTSTSSDCGGRATATSGPGGLSPQDAAVAEVNRLLMETPVAAKNSKSKASGKAELGGGEVGADCREGDGDGARDEAGDSQGKAQPLRGVWCDILVSPKVVYRSRAGCGIKLVAVQVFKH